MAKKSRAQKELEAQNSPESAPKKPLSKYALKKLAQQKAELNTLKYEAAEQKSEPSDSSASVSSGADESPKPRLSRRTTTNNRRGSTNNARGRTTNNSRGRTNRSTISKKGAQTDEQYFAQQEKRRALATAKAAQAAREGAEGIEFVETKPAHRAPARKVSFARRGRVITVVRKDAEPTKSKKQQEKSAEHYEKLRRHNQAIREARQIALEKFQAEGREHLPFRTDTRAIPDKITFNRTSVFTCGVEIMDRVPNLTDWAEREASIQPHNRRDNMLFAPIKREAKPLTGTDFMAKYLDNWSKDNDPQGIFKDLFEQVKRVRSSENGIAYIGLPAFLKFLEGTSKSLIMDQYAFEFRHYIKRREITDFIRAMQPTALDWMKNRHPLEPYYAFVYFDTYPIHVKLGKKKVITEQVLFILGVTLDGRKDILGIVPDITAKRVSVPFWDKILSHLQSLGCLEICFVVAACKCRYLERSVKTYYPNATMTFNLLELLQFDSFSLPQVYRAQFMEDAAELTQCVDYEQGYAMLNEMRDKWEKLMPVGSTILQGNVEHLKIYSLLGQNERKIFTTHKMVASAAALLMGNKTNNDFFSDNAEMLNFLFYRYLLAGKPYWTEHQDYAINNLSFSKLFSQLRHLDLPGSKLLNELLSEQHQEFMLRHFGAFGNGPVFNLNPNKKLMSLAGQIYDNASFTGDNWNDKSNSALNTAPEQELTEPNPELVPSPKDNESSTKTHILSSTTIKEPQSLAKEAERSLNKSAVVTDSHGSVLTLKKNSALSTTDFVSKGQDMLSLNTTELSPVLSNSSIFSLDNMLVFESQALGALGGFDLERGLTPFLNPNTASLTLSANSLSSFMRPNPSEDKEPKGKHKADLKQTANKHSSTPAPSKLAMAIALDYPRFKRSHILINGQEYVFSPAAVGELDQNKIQDQVLNLNDDIDGIEKLDNTFGFKMVTTPSSKEPKAHAKLSNTVEHSIEMDAEHPSQYQPMSDKLNTLSEQYDVDSLSGLDGIDKLDPACDINNSKTPNNYSSNIQSANAVMGMLRPSIAQALRQERLALKKQERELIFACLGPDFKFDNMDNVINQVTPIFRSAMQTKIKWYENQEKEKLVLEKKRQKAKARERYLKRQAAKAAAAAAAAPAAAMPLTDKDFEPLSANDFNALQSVAESSALKGDTHEQAITISSSNSGAFIIAPEDSSLRTPKLSTDSTTLGTILSPISNDEDDELTLTKPADAKVPVVAAEFRNAVAAQLATVGGVQTQKPDTTIKLKD